MIVCSEKRLQSEWTREDNYWGLRCFIPSIEYQVLLLCLQHISRKEKHWYNWVLRLQYSNRNKLGSTITEDGGVSYFYFPFIEYQMFRMLCWKCLQRNTRTFHYFGEKKLQSEWSRDFPPAQQSPKCFFALSMFCMWKVVIMKRYVASVGITKTLAVVINRWNVQFKYCDMRFLFLL